MPECHFYWLTTPAVRERGAVSLSKDAQGPSPGCTLHLTQGEGSSNCFFPSSLLEFRGPQLGWRLSSGAVDAAMWKGFCSVVCGQETRTAQFEG